MIDLPRVVGAGAVRGGSDQVFAHRQVREYLAAFRHQSEPQLRDLVVFQVLDFPALERDRAAMSRHHPHQGTDGRRLAHAVTPQQGDYFAFIDSK